MSAVAVDIAHAVADLINQPGLSSPANATRAWVPQVDLDSLDQRRVTVVPGEVEMRTETRSTSSFEVEVLVGVQQRTPDTDAVDALVAYAQEILDRLRFTDLSGATWLSAAMDPVVSADMLREHDAALSIVRARYIVWRD